MFKNKSLVLIVLLILLPSIFAEGALQTAFVAGSFTKEQADGIPVGWIHRELKGKNVYSLVDDEGTKVLKAESKSAASGLFRNTNINPKEFPIVNWQWKTTHIPNNADESKKDGDDCAARVFVIFEDSLPNASSYSKFKHKLATSVSSFLPKGVAICYIWGNKLNKDQHINSPYTDWVRVVAVESGSNKLGQWVNIERNVFEDFKNIYGTEPKKIVGLAVMTDSDQTKDTVITYYKDIIFKPTGTNPRVRPSS